MKAPDKIYLHPDDRHWWQEGNKTDDRFVEYIRKDALLELLLSLEAKYSVFYIQGKIIRDVIDKIDSL